MRKNLRSRHIYPLHWFFYRWGLDKTLRCRQVSQTRWEWLPSKEGMCGGYKENGDGVATEEMSDGGSIEQNGSHSKTPVLEKDNVCGWIVRVLRPKVKSTHHTINYYRIKSRYLLNINSVGVDSITTWFSIHMHSAWTCISSIIFTGQHQLVYTFTCVSSKEHNNTACLALGFDPIWRLLTRNSWSRIRQQRPPILLLTAARKEEPPAGTCAFVRVCARDRTAT